MKLFKNKKSLKIATFSSFFIISTVAAAGATLASCSTKKNVTVPSTTASSFSSLTSSILPTIASVLSSKSGQTTLTKSYVNKLLLNWFSVVSDSSIEVTYKQWVKDAEKAYKNEYDNYKKKKGANWQQLFQQNVLDPVGGTRQDYINNNIVNNIKTTFIDYMFGSSSKEYLGYKDSSDGTITPINNINLVSLSDIDNSYVNATTVGEKNGFTFSADAVASNERKTIDYGYADFMEYLMDSWIKEALPLPLSMSLWKNGTSEQKIKNLFSSYFTQDNTPEGYTSGSYAFQYFEPITDSNLQTLTTTGKFKILMTNLANGSYVSSSTGLIKLDSSYTEDTSTSLIVPSKNLFDGTYVTPFSAGAWYKFSNAVFGVSDTNVPTSSSIDASSIMKNFLSYSTSESADDTSSTNSNGVFSFPYTTTWKNTYTGSEGSVFLGEYEGATGVKDVINLSDKATIDSSDTSGTNNSQLGNFILVRNTYGVHLIGIDRLSQLKAAASSVTDSTNNGFAAKFQKVCNELRNTFIYYYALDTVGGTSTYSVKDKLKTYLTDNFESLILNYVEKSVDNPSTQTNNLFGVKATTDTTDTTIDYTNNFGFPSSGSKDYSNYYGTLNEIKSDTQLRRLIDAAQAYATAESLNSFNSTLKSAIYSNQSSYNSNTSSSTWIQNGIAGVLPYKRDASTGDFTSLMSVFNSIATSTNNSTSNITTSSNNSTARNASTRSSGQLSANITTVTNANTTTNLTIAKNNYQSAVVSYLNNIDLVVNPDNKTTGKSTYIFTNNYYVNQALLTTGSDGTLNAIVYNSYVQKYLLPNGVDKWHLTKPTSISNTSTEGSTEWVFDKIYSGIKSTYFVSSFAGISNIYSEGDWKTQSDFETKATNYWYSNWEATQYSYTFNDGSENSSSSSFYSYSTPDNAKSYYNFLSTINYLLTYDSETETFSFNKLYEILNNATTVTSSNTGKAMVAWQNMSSIVANPSYGVTASSSVSNIQSKMQEDSTFKALPIYLTNSNSYSWYGNLNPYTIMNTNTPTDSSNTFTKNDISYTTSTSYWYSAPMSSSSTDTNTGFLGFQFENTADTGVSTSLPSDAFTNSTYANPISYKSSGTTTEEVKYRGMFYSFTSRSEMVSYVQGLSTANLLSTFYQNNLRDSGLPVTDANKTKIKEIIDNDSITGSERVKQLQEAIVDILNDNNQVPDSAFQKMDGMPLWNNSNNVQSTLFDSSDSTGALKNEYVITQFNNVDVQKLLSTDTSTDKKTLNTGSGAYLGLNSTTFFNAIIMLCNSSTKLQDQANDAMLRQNGKISVYDIRLLSVLGRSYISNYDVWEKVKNLS